MKPFTTVAVGVFALVALAQLIRVVSGWEIRINGLLVPAWVSIVICVFAATLAVLLWRQDRT